MLRSARQFIASSLAIAAFFAAGAAAQTPSIQALPGLGGSSVSMSPQAISADGSTVVGWTSLNGTRAVKWSEQTGLVDLSPGFIAYDVNHDGSVIVGRFSNHAARWEQGSGWTTLPDTFSGTAYATNHSGSVIVGSESNLPASRAFRWVEGQGTEILPLPVGVVATTAAATAVSADGQIVFGRYGPFSTTGHGMRWTATGGTEAYPGITFLNATNPSGKVAVGSGGGVGARWTSQGITRISGPSSSGGAATAVSGDGRFVYGQVTNGSAYIWDEIHGYRVLQQFLQQTYGLDFTGLTLRTVTGITPDGTAMVGEMSTPQGTRGYIIRVPHAPPADPPVRQWRPVLEGGLHGVNGRVYTMKLWDPDGPGPREPLLILGGSFSMAGNAAPSHTSHIVALDLSTGMWSNLGWGLEGSSSVVRALAVLPSGELVAGGHFHLADGRPANGVAVWNGEEWKPLGLEYGESLGSVEALAVLPDGTLIAGGTFGGTSAPAQRIARWTGEAWVPLEGGGIAGGILALAATPEGHLIAAGNFLTAGDPPVEVNRVARWDGTSWSPLGAGLSGHARTILVHSSGDIYIGGDFVQAGGTTVNYVARWDGNAWHPLGLGMTASGSTPRHVYSLAEMPAGSSGAGDVIVGGLFTIAGGVGGVTVNHIARWDGANWHPLGGGMGGPYPTSGIQGVLSLLPLGGDELFAAGNFGSADGIPSMNLARWNGSAWSTPATGFDGPIGALNETPAEAGGGGGETIAGGTFTRAGGTPANNIAAWNGQQWNALGSGLVDAIAPHKTRVRAIISYEGDVVAGGHFNTAGGHPALRIARWDGHDWSAMGAGFNHAVEALALYPGTAGTLQAGGSFMTSGGNTVRAIGHWNGTSWLPTGGGGAVGETFALQVSEHGLFAGGTLSSLPGVAAPNGLGVWNGQHWSDVSGGLSGGLVYSFAVLPDGDLAVGGSFNFMSAGGRPIRALARWDGVEWHPMLTNISGGSGTYSPRVSAMAIMPDGDLIIGGSFDNLDGLMVNSIARFDGTGWHRLGDGLFLPGNTKPSVEALLVTAGGDLLVGGNFMTAGPVLSPYLARWSFPPPACYANCDHSTLHPVLNVDDFTCFINEFAFASQLPHAQQITHYANCDGSTIIPILNVDDFTCFINAFAAGCP